MPGQRLQLGRFQRAAALLAVASVLFIGLVPLFHHHGPDDSESDCSICQGYVMAGTAIPAIPAIASVPSADFIAPAFEAGYIVASPLFHPALSRAPPA